MSLSLSHSSRSAREDQASLWSQRKAARVARGKQPAMAAEAGEGKVMLASRLDKEQIEVIHDLFKAKLSLDPARPRLMGSEFELTKLRQDELREVLCDTFGIKLRDEDFHVIFLKMDTNRSGSITWDEVVSHLLVELAEVTGPGGAFGSPSASTEMLTDPINTLPEVIRSPHRNPILRITFWPEVSPDRSFNYLQGNFVTASHDGGVQFWTMDMRHLRLVQSKTALLKIRPTWVTDVVCMPDVNIMCTSSTERELRFYDTRATKWELRVLISAMDKPVVTMHYHMGGSEEEDSILILGDTAGMVQTLNFRSLQGGLGGPFHQHVGKETTHVFFKDLFREGLPGVRVVQFPVLHSNWVRQVYYYASLQSILSCAACPRASLIMYHTGTGKNHYKYNVVSGVYCFGASEESHMIATGGPDSVLRIWNPFVREKPSAQLVGHHAAIVAVVIQDDGSKDSRPSGIKIFSLDAARCVRVWDGHSHTCIQAYSAMMDNSRVPIATYYHPVSRVWMVAGRDISLVQLCAQLNPDRTDGQTHTAPVSTVLYNPLFKCVVTTGMDSCIMVWDPWRGTRTRLVKHAHLAVRYGRDEPVEITAACFDPPLQLLLTGASNGTLKIWNFNTGICVRNMTIGNGMEVTAVMWVPLRILAVGWNMRVMEWADGSASLRGKSWELRHTSHVLCADTRAPDALATGTDNGELVIWRLETGQPYARYRVDAPVHKSGMSHYVESEVKPPRYWTPVHMPRSTGVQGMPPRVHQMRFLKSRPVSRGVGSLLVSLSTGYIQVWSHHPVGGYLMNFLAVHTVADYVMCMETDPECNFLFTGHSAGYIKVWLMSNFCFPGGPVVTLFMPAMRKQFPFLFRDRIAGRAKRAVKEQPLPMLLSSVRGHLQPVTSLQYSPENKIIFSSSADRSVRLWSLSGEYLSTLGQQLPWPPLSPDCTWDPDDEPPRIPADLKRVSSSTTIKVLKRGSVEWLTPSGLKRPKKMQSLKPITAEDVFPGTYGMRLYKPILGHSYALPSKAIGSMPTVSLETDLPRIPVYHHIRTVEEQDMERPPTPECLHAIRNFK